MRLPRCALVAGVLHQLMLALPGVATEDVVGAAGATGGGAGSCTEGDPTAPAAATEQFLMRKLEAATREVRRQVKMRHRQVSGSCSDRAGLTQLAGPAQALRVGTYNLWNLNSNWPLRQRGIQSMLSYLKSDIIAVQEIRWLPGQEWPVGGALEAEGDAVADPGAQVEAAAAGGEATALTGAGGDAAEAPPALPCAEDQRVALHKCVACPEFEHNTAGDDPAGDDTACAVRYKADGGDPRLDAREAQLVALAASAGYDHYALRSAAAAARRAGANWTAPGGFDEEAVGLLSRHPIVDTQELPLPPPWDAPDRNPRVILAPLVNVSSADFSGPVRVLSSHLSYETGEQCRTVPLLAAFADRLWREDAVAFGTNGRPVPQLIMGDLNTYFDFEWPFDVLTRPAGGLAPNSPLNPCAPQFAASGYVPDAAIPAFRDAWETANPAEDAGYTFPNPETATTLPPARCDRILFRGFDLAEPPASPLTARRAAVIGCEPLGMSGTHMSDHRYVVADFLAVES